MVDDAAVVIFVVYREAVAELVRASAQRQVVLLHDTLLIDRVGIVAGVVVLLQACQLVLQFGVGHVAEGFLVEGILYWRDNACPHCNAIGSRCQRVSHLAVVVEEIVVPVGSLGIHLLRRCHVEVVGIIDILVLIDGEVGREVDVYLACLLGVLGGHNDDAVRRAGTVYGVSGSVFQHVDALDVVRVEVVDGAFDGKPVNDEEWRCLGIERRCAADGHLAVVGGQACHASLEVVHDVRGVSLVEFRRGDGCHRAGHLRLRNLLIARHHHLFEHEVCLHLHVAFQFVAAFGQMYLRC